MRTDILAHASNELRALETELAAKEQLECFDMGHWFVPGTGTDPKCGSAGCFIGWAGIRGWFEQWGLKITFEPRVIGADFQVPRFGIDGFSHSHMESVIRKFFGLEYNDTVRMLVEPEHYEDDVSPSMVADRIDRLIEVGEDQFLLEMQPESHER